MKLTKKDVQKRVLQNGKPLALSKFSWDERAKTFSSQEDDLVLDFNDINDCTFKTGSHCTFKTGSRCIFKTGSDCTFKTGSGCIFDTESRCTFDTDYNCTFDTGDDCTFDTGSHCTFKTGSDCTFKTRERCVVVRRYVFEVIKLEGYVEYQLAPCEIKGYLKDGVYSETSKPCIIADGILSEVISKKKSGNVEVYKVKNYDEDEEKFSKETSFIVKEGNLYSHGKTIKEAKKSLLYKISDRDTSKFSNLTSKSKLTLKECIQAYRTITGACESMTRDFVENNMQDRDYTIKELIDLTKGQYGNDTFEEFFKNKGK